MRYEKGEWVQRVKAGVYEFLSVLQEFVRTVVFAGSVFVIGYFGSQMYDEHQTIVQLESRSTRQHLHKDKPKRSEAVTGFIQSTPPSPSPAEPILIPMGPARSP